MAERIAFFLATSGHSGVDRLMGNLLPELARRGFAVDLVKIRHHGPAIEAPGVHVIPLPASHAATALPALLRYLKARRPTFLISDKDRVNRIALLANRCLGCPAKAVVRIGTTPSVNLADRPLLDRSLQRFSMRHLYPLAHRVLVPSRGVAEDMAGRMGVPEERIRVVPNPLIPSGMAQRSREPVPHPWFSEGIPIILGAGELCERKDFETLLRAFARVRKARPCRLVILGRGRRRERLWALADKLGIAEDLDLPGFVPHPWPWMARAALFVLSSRWEGLGNVLVEALALGTPCVATDCPSGPREILQEGRFGPLVAVGDDEALARAMLDTLENPLPKETLREAAAPYTIEAAASRWLEAMA